MGAVRGGSRVREHDLNQLFVAFTATPNPDRAQLRISTRFRASVSRSAGLSSLEMLFERQRLLLTMLDALDGPVANTDVQKLLFLYTRQCEPSPTYEFVPYERKSLPRQTQALARIRGWVQDGERVALTCFERLPRQCHRHCVAEAQAQHAGNDLVALHLQGIRDMSAASASNGSALAFGLHDIHAA